MTSRPGRSRAASRALDVAVAAVGLVVAGPVIGLTALAIGRRDPGPMLYRDRREGRDGRPFDMLKLRTMTPDGDRVLAAHLAADPVAREEWFRYYRLTRDPRIRSRAARAARRLSIDELPQLVNVLRGEMSLVGPRPLPSSILDTLDPAFVALRRGVRPGLTGLWQVTGRSDLDMTGLERLDREYLHDPSLRGDLRILARTPAAVLSGSGAY